MGIAGFPDLFLKLKESLFGVLHTEKRFTSWTVSREQGQIQGRCSGADTPQF